MNLPSPQKRKKICCDSEQPKLLLQLSTLLNTRECLDETHRPKTGGQGQCPKNPHGQYHLLAELIQHLNPEDGRCPVTRKKPKDPSSLLTYGEDVNVTICKAGMTLLHHVFSKQNQRGQSSLVFDNDPNIDEDLDGGGNVDKSVLKLLMKAGVDVNIRKDEMSSSLHKTIPNRLLDENLSICSKSSDLKVALQGLHECLVKLLVNNEAEVNCREEDSDPLHQTALQSHLKILKILMKFGTEINLSNCCDDDKNSNATVDLVKEKCQKEESEVEEGKDLVNLLMTSGSGVNSLCEKRKPLHCHFNQRLLHSLDLLLFNGARVNCFDIKDPLLP